MHGQRALHAACHAAVDEPRVAARRPSQDSASPAVGRASWASRGGRPGSARPAGPRRSGGAAAVGRRGRRAAAAGAALGAHARARGGQRGLQARAAGLHGRPVGRALRPALLRQRHHLRARGQGQGPASRQAPPGRAAGPPPSRARAARPHRVPHGALSPRGGRVRSPCHGPDPGCGTGRRGRRGGGGARARLRQLRQRRLDGGGGREGEAQAVGHGVHDVEDRVAEGGARARARRAVLLVPRHRQRDQLCARATLFTPYFWHRQRDQLCARVTLLSATAPPA